MIMHPAIKLRHIRAFLDIAASGNLTMAARAQGITQPALSRALAELETLLGQKLFLRQGRRLFLSEAGTLFRRHASTGLQAFEAGAQALRQKGDGGTVRVGILPTVATRFFPSIALQFQMLNPEITLAIVTGPHAHLIDRLRSGGLDLMVGRMPETVEMRDLSFEYLYEEPVVICARAGHPHLDLPVDQLLRRVPLVLPPGGAIIRRVVDGYLATQGLVGLHAAIETVSLAMGRGILVGSDAVWFISRGVIQDELDRGILVEIPTHAQFLSGAVGLTYRQSGLGAPGLDMLMHLTRTAAQTAKQGRS